RSGGGRPRGPGGGGCRGRERHSRAARVARGGWGIAFTPFPDLFSPVWHLNRGKPRARGNPVGGGGGRGGVGWFSHRGAAGTIRVVASEFLERSLGFRNTEGARTRGRAPVRPGPYAADR